VIRARNLLAFVLPRGLKRFSSSLVWNIHGLHVSFVFLKKSPSVSPLFISHVVSHPECSRSNSDVYLGVSLCGILQYYTAGSEYECMQDFFL
jgi:hypothetical protein